MSEMLSQLVDIVSTRYVSETASLGQIHDWRGRSGGAVAAVVRPASSTQVSKIMQLATQERIPVQVQGGNTSLSGGSIPPQSGTAPILMCLDRISGVRQTDSDIGQIIAGAGTPIAEVQRVAAEHGWFYGVDLAARDSATIGGTVATNAGGIRVCAYGSTRAQILGLDFVLPDGAVVMDRPGLIKDNTGYDFAGLLCGSEGTLAIVTQVRVKLWRPPMTATTVALPVASLTEAAALAGSAAAPGCTLLAAEVVDRVSWHAVSVAEGNPDPFAQSVDDFVLLLEVGDGGGGQGLTNAVTDRPTIAVAADANQRRSLWELREAQTTWWSRQPGKLYKLDVSIPPSQLDQIALESNALSQRLGGQSGIFGHIREGNLHIQIVVPGHEDPTSKLLALVGDLGGSISAEHGIGRDKVRFLNLRRSTAEMAAMRAIKRSLDPQGLLNPGVLFD